MKPLAVVSGGNRGLGLEVCRRLAALGYEVRLGSRDVELGRDAARALRGEVKVEPLDVTDAASISALRERLAGRRIDALVSNAGISLKGFDSDVVRRTLAVNYFGATALVRELLPALGRGTRVVMVSSGMGELSGWSARRRVHFDPPISYAAIEEALATFQSDVDRARETAEGWPRSAYRVSKAALNAWTRLFAEEVRPRGILVNAICPGWVRTDMGGAGASRSLEVGGEGLVWAATLPEDGPTGGFFRDGRAVAW